MTTTLERYEQYINPALARLFRFMGLGTEAVWAQGTRVRDADGNEYLDFLGNFGVFSLGHRHPKVIAAVKGQLDGLPQTVRYLTDEAAGRLAEELARITPGALQYSFFCNSGAEAVEGAIKLARLKTGKTKVIAAQNAFHGKTFGALSASGRDLFRQPFEPLLPGFVHVPFGDAQAVEEAIDDHTAAVILEPIQGEGGIVVPPPGYLREVRDICSRNDVLLILDEVQTGLGRTGKMFACDHEEVAPDILCLAKALGGGVMPIGAVVATAEVWAPMAENPWIHTSTFGGNPLACRAALATLEVLEGEDLPRQAARSGEYLLDALGLLKERYPEVLADVRGKGLLVGLELAHEGIGGVLISRFVEEGVIVGYTLNNPKVIRLEPPLPVSREELDRVLEVLEKGLQEASAMGDDW